MEKSSKFRNIIREYSVSILIGLTVLLPMLAIAISVQHIFALVSITVLTGVCFYLIWRNN